MKHLKYGNSLTLKFCQRMADNSVYVKGLSVGEVVELFHTHLSDHVQIADHKCRVPRPVQSEHLGITSTGHVMVHLYFHSKIERRQKGDFD